MSVAKLMTKFKKVQFSRQMSLEDPNSQLMKIYLYDTSCMRM